MKELLEYIVKQIVSKPEEVEVSETTSGNNVDLVVKVAEDDLGAVIGKSGKVANSIRSVVRTSAKKYNKRVNIKFM